MKALTDFVQQHLSDDTTRLILDRDRYPEIDMELAVSCIESRRKLKGKMQEWYENPDLVFPLKISAEQCSSSATGRYKAEMAERIGRGFLQQDPAEKWTVADLTGGLGVDSWFFSQRADKVFYCEMQSKLCEAARHNFSTLGAVNISISNIEISENTDYEFEGLVPDIIYIDPARRGAGGKKVFLIEDCTPDVLKLKETIFRKVRHILIKLSPMADITMVCDRLGKTCREVHVVASGGECKELLVWMDREWNGEPEIIAAEIDADNNCSMFRFTYSEERSSNPEPGDIGQSGAYLFEPGKALMKAAPFNLMSSRFGLHKLGKSTHYYTTGDQTAAEYLKRYGKVFRIIECMPLDKRSMKEIGRKYRKAEVTARNIPMDTDSLRKKTGITSGDDAHIFGLKSDLNGNLLIVAKRL